MRSKNLTKVPLAGIILLLAGCGFYSFKGSVPPHLHNVQVRPFDNLTTEFAVETDLEDALLERLRNERILPLVSSEDGYSYLEGTIKSIQDNPYLFDESENVLEYRHGCRGEIVWYDQVRDTELFRKPFNEFGTYFSDLKNSSLGDEDQRTREQAYDEGLELIISKIIESMTEEW